MLPHPTIRSRPLALGLAALAVLASALPAPTPAPDPATDGMEEFPPSPSGGSTYPDDFYPFIDRFGQYRHLAWKDKVADEADLLARFAAERAEIAALRPTAFGRFGGWRHGPRLEPTGFFRTAKLDGRWWLVDPEGYLFLSSGVTTVGSALRTDASGAPSMRTGISGREHFFAEIPPAGSPARALGIVAQETATVTSGEYQGQRPLAANFFALNALRQMPGAGASAESLRAATSTLAFDRLRSWGFTSIGGWSDPDLFGREGRVPYTHVLVYVHPGLINGSTTWLDYFRDAFPANLRTRLAEELGRTIGDPWNIGFYIDNERDWTKSNVSARDLGLTVLASPAENLERYAKRALHDQLRAKHGTIGALNAAWGVAYADWDDFLARRDVVPSAAASAADFAAFEELYAETYFSACRAAMRELAPQHLYLGCRFTTGGRAPLMRAASRHADVFTVNIYGSAIRLLTGMEADVPVMSTEYHFWAEDTGLFSDAVASSARRTSQALRASALRDYLASFVASPRFVGAHWFQYYDYPASGRLNSRNMNSNLGLVHAGNLPYSDLVVAARAQHYGMYRSRYVPPKRQAAADIHVLADQPDSAPGASPLLVVGPGAEAYLRFDLANVTSVVDRATLLLTPKSGDSLATHVVSPLGASGWDEATTSWSRRPEAGPGEVGRFTSRPGLPVEIDVTSRLREAWLRDRVVALRVSSIAGRLDYASREAGASDERPQLLLVTSPATLAEWRARHFVAGSSAGDAGADPDADGTPNLLEYALGMSPLEPEAPGLVVDRATDGGAPALRFPRARADIVYTVESAEGNGPWSPVAIDPGAVGATVVVPLPEPGAAGSMLVRLRVATR